MIIITHSPAAFACRPSPGWRARRLPLVCESIQYDTVWVTRVYGLCSMSYWGCPRKRWSESSRRPSVALWFYVVKCCFLERLAELHTAIGGRYMRPPNPNEDYDKWFGLWVICSSPFSFLVWRCWLANGIFAPVLRMLTPWRWEPSEKLDLIERARDFDYLGVDGEEQMIDFYWKNRMQLVYTKGKHIVVSAIETKYTSIGEKLVFFGMNKYIYYCESNVVSALDDFWRRTASLWNILGMEIKKSQLKLNQNNVSFQTLITALLFLNGFHLSLQHNNLMKVDQASRSDAS